MSSLDPGILLLFAVLAYRNLMFLFIILSLLQSFAGFTPPDALRPAVNFVHDIVDPFLRLFRGLLPALRLGGMGLDLSPILAFIVIDIVYRVLLRIV